MKKEEKNHDMNFVKTISTAAIVLLLTGITFGMLKLVTTNYIQNAPLGFALILLGAITVFYFAVRGIRIMWASCFVLMAFLMQSCNYAKSNQQVVISSDCGVTWSKINAGESVPKGVGNYCFMKVVIPNYPMQGDSRFISNLKDKVRAQVHIDYDYSITDPLAFIKQAKYLGKANSNADSGDALDPSAFEGAENMVIDKRIRDVSKALFLTQDIIELDQAELEDKLLIDVNKVLEPLGVHLNFMSLTFDLDEQTRTAIDVTVAMQVYQSKGLGEVGKQVMIERAGATKINIEVPKEAKVE
jgi:hypothetical protein